MDRSMLASMREVETTHWWFVARRELLLAVMDKCVPPNAGVLLDVGCGTGANLEALAWRFPELTAIGLDADPFCRAACEARGLRVCDASAEALPVDDNSQDVITALDVLEHLDDDVSALQEMARTLSPDGYLILGGGETTLTVGDTFVPVQFGRTIGYQRTTTGNRPRRAAA